MWQITLDKTRVETGDAEIASFRYDTREQMQTGLKRIIESGGLIRRVEEIKEGIVWNETTYPYDIRFRMRLNHQREAQPLFEDQVQIVHCFDKAQAMRVMSLITEMADKDAVQFVSFKNNKM